MCLLYTYVFYQWLIYVLYSGDDVGEWVIVSLETIPCGLGFV